MAGRERSYSADGGPGRRNVPQLKKRAKARGIKLAGHEAGGQQRLEFGSKYELAAGLVQVKRLDAQTVARENQFALAGIPDCEGEHAAKFFDESLAIFLVEMKDNFRVRRGAEGMAAPFEFGAQFGGVVAFAVVGDPGLAIRRWTWACARDRSRSMMERRAFTRRHDPEFLDALAVRAAVFHGGGHEVRGRAQRLVRMCRRDPCNAAHAVYFPTSASRQRGTSRRCLGMGTGCGICESLGRRYNTPISSHKYALFTKF